MSLVQLSHHEVRLGRPLDFAVFSSTGKLLMSKGYVVQSESQLERLFSSGAFRDDSASSTGARVPMAAPAPERRQTRVLTSVAAEPAAAAAPSAQVARFPSPANVFESFQLSVTGSSEPPVAAQYTGMVHGKSLLVTARGGGDNLEQGVEVEARVMSGRSIYLFSTRVVARHRVPFDVIYLEYPASVKRHALRQYLRIDADLPARLLRNDAVTSGFEATVVNLSQNGLGISLPNASLEVGEHFKVSVRLKVANRIHAVMLNCIVRNARMQSGVMMVGAEFGATTDEIRRLIKDYLFDSTLDSRV